MTPECALGASKVDSGGTRVDSGGTRGDSGGIKVGSGGTTVDSGFPQMFLGLLENQVAGCWFGWNEVPDLLRTAARTPRSLLGGERGFAPNTTRSEI